MIQQEPCQLSQPASVNNSLQKTLKGRSGLLQSIPNIRVIVLSWIGEVSQSPERVDLHRLPDLVSRDKSISAH